MSILKKIITKGLFGNRYILKIKHIGKDSKIGIMHNILNGQYISIGDHCAIGRFSKLHCYDHFGGEKLYPEIVIGDHCTFGQNLTLWGADKIHIEDWVTLAGYCSIISENHGIDPENEVCYRDQPLHPQPVIIKEGTWIGERCCVLPGVTIGKRCVVGSGSVVTKSIPDYSMAVGNPARIIKTWNFDTHKWEKC